MYREERFKRIDLRELDIFSLKAIDADKHYLLPDYSGVYIVFNDLKEVVYIGQSAHIRDRITSHNKIKDLNENNNLKIVCFEVCKKNNFHSGSSNIAAENTLIDIYSPLANETTLPSRWIEMGDEKYFYYINTSSKWEVNQTVVKKYENENQIKKQNSGFTGVKASDLMALVNKMSKQEIKKLIRILLEKL